MFCTKKPVNRCERKDCHRPAKINFALPVPGIQEVLFQMMDGTKNSVESNKDPKTDSERYFFKETLAGKVNSQLVVHLNFSWF